MTSGIKMAVPMGSNDMTLSFHPFAASIFRVGSGKKMAMTTRVRPPMGRLM